MDLIALKASTDKLVEDVTTAVSVIKKLAAQIADNADDAAAVQALTDEMNNASATLEAALPKPVEPGSQA